MGYSTEFTGEFSITPRLRLNHLKYLKAFAESRHMKRDTSKIPNINLIERARLQTDLDCGVDGEFCFNESPLENSGQRMDESILNYNKPPGIQPSLWCQWIPNEEGDKLKWDGVEKFTGYIDWLVYLIRTFFSRPTWGYTLNGCVKWQGEHDDDRGTICLHNNVITIYSLKNLSGYYRDFQMNKASSWGSELLEKVNFNFVNESELATEFAGLNMHINQF